MLGGLILGATYLGQASPVVTSSAVVVFRAIVRTSMSALTAVRRLVATHD